MPALAGVVGRTVAAAPTKRDLTKDRRSSSLLWVLWICVDDRVAVVHRGVLWKETADDRMERRSSCWNFIMLF